MNDEVLKNLELAARQELRDWANGSWYDLPEDLWNGITDALTVRYIILASPKNILDLIEENDGLRRELEAVNEDANDEDHRVINAILSQSFSGPSQRFAGEN